MTHFICPSGESHSNHVTKADASQTHMSLNSNKTNAVIAHTHPPPDSPSFSHAMQEMAVCVGLWYVDKKELLLVISIVETASNLW